MSDGSGKVLSRATSSGFSGNLIYGTPTAQVATLDDTEGRGVDGDLGSVRTVTATNGFDNQIRTGNLFGFVVGVT